MNLGGIVSSIGNLSSNSSLPNEMKIQQYEENQIMSNYHGKDTTLTDTQIAFDNTDQYIQSPEIANTMNQIGGTESDDNIRAWSNEDGSITVNVNGKETVYDYHEALNGFRITSGDGNDSIDFSAVGATIIVNAGEGDNEINLSTGRNIVNAGDGNNTITGVGSYRTNISLGSGDNKIEIGASGNKYNTIRTGDGNNTITTGDAKGAISTGLGNDTITVGNGSSKIFSDGGTNTIKAGNGDNAIRGGIDNDTITVGNGNNKIYAGDGDDSVIAGDGNNYIEGGNGNDTISVKDGNNVIYGLDGNDTITVGSGNNYIDGGKGNDTINAVGGDNVIFGGLGEDTVNTSGEKTTVFDDGDGSGINANGASVNLYDSTEKASLGKSIRVEGSSDFKMRVESDLESYRAMESGSELLKQLDNAKHETTIIELHRDVQNGYASADDTKYVKSNGERGDGSDAVISYNPSFSLSQGTNTAPPSDVLFHESVHAYNDVTGTMQEGQMERANGTLVNRCEHQAVGLPVEGGIEVTHPDGTTTSENPSLLTENAYRREIGIQERTKY